MTRREIIELLDGSNPDRSGAVATLLHAMIVASAIAISIETMPDLPAGFHEFLFGFEIALLAVFAAEYVLRAACAEHPFHYIFSFWGVIDLLSILPAIALLRPELQVVRVIRLVRLLKLFRTSRALDRLLHAFLEVRGELMVFAVIAALVLYVAAVGIYLFEHDAQPEAFNSIPKSLWWAVASLTTVGYGDLYPITPGGRIFTTFVLFIGLGVVAVPAAIVTTALLEAETTIEPRKKKKKKKNKDQTEAKDATNKGENDESY